MNARCRTALLASALPLLTVAFLAFADPNAVITLGTIPEPPDCVCNPGGMVTIFWEVQHATTPNYVYYRLDDPIGDMVEEQTYPGDTGIAITRTWTVPNGAQDGVYWAHVEYWSVEIGLEAEADVAFVVCSGTPTDGTTWGEIKALYR